MSNEEKSGNSPTESVQMGNALNLDSHLGADDETRFTDSNLRNTLESLVFLTGFSDEDRRLIQEAADHTSKWTDELVKMFYNTLFSYPLTKAVFHAGERFDRESTLRNWYLRLASGVLDDQFWGEQWRVGMPHIERKVPNSFMFGAMHRVQQFLLDKCLAEFGMEKGLALYQAFKRATDISTGLIAEGYHSTYAVIKVPR